jgi:spore coat polysaccharide biosynthesis predicted glycosyltransferase SpsG/RimJ/RimL family protein N-acetyltransferase
MKLKIFTEAGHKVGYGHLSRSIAIYNEAVNFGHNAELYIFGSEVNEVYLENLSYSIFNWIDKTYLENKLTIDDHAIVDSYIASYEIYEIIYAKCKRTIFIDDYNRMLYPKGIIINPSLSIDGLKNKVKQNLLFGNKFIIVRDSFLKYKRIEISTDVKNVLIIFGGIDNLDLSNLFIEILCPIFEDIKFTLISNKDIKSNYINLKVKQSLTENELAAAMSKSDLVITAAGQTIYELLVTKTPFIVIKTAYNQNNNILSLKRYFQSQIIIDINSKNIKNDIIKNFKNGLKYNYRNNQTIEFNNLIDGKGKKRILDILTNKEDYDKIMIRDLNEGDIYSIFELSNKEYVRKNSINNNQISWSEHKKWFKIVSTLKSYVTYIICTKEIDFLGQIRFQIIEKKALISISLTEFILGKKLSKKLLKMSLNKFFIDYQFIELIEAIINLNNIGSIKSFESLGFKKKSDNQTFNSYELSKGEYYENQSY